LPLEEVLVRRVVGPIQHKQAIHLADQPRIYPDEPAFRVLVVTCGTEVEVSVIAPVVVVEVPAERQGVAEVGMGVAGQELKRPELDFRVVNHLNMNFTDSNPLDH